MNRLTEQYSYKYYTPTHYQQQFEKDLQQGEESTAKRAAGLALPLLSLYQPFGKLISIAGNGLRVFSNGLSLKDAESWTEVGKKTASIALASIALAATLYSFTLGLMITTGVDLLQNSASMLEAFARGEWGALGSELMHAVGSSLFFAIILTGSLEAALAALVIQGVISFVQAREELSKGRIPEAIVKSIVGLARFYQAGVQIERIKTMRFFKKHVNPKIFERLRNAKKVDHLSKTPDLQWKDLKDFRGDVIGKIATLDGMGEGLLSDGTVTFKKIDDVVTVSFKLNNPSGRELDKSIHSTHEFERLLTSSSRQEIFHMLGLHADSYRKGIYDNYFGGMVDLPHARFFYEHFDGLGRLRFTDPYTCGQPRAYNMVEIELEDGRGLYDLHEILSFHGLEGALYSTND